MGHMSKLVHAIRQHSDLSIEAQVLAGKPLGDSMPAPYVDWLKRAAAAIDAGDFSPDEPKSLLSPAYASASETEQGKVDLVLPTLADSLRHIVDFYGDPATPDACPQLKTMIDHLGDMLGRLGPVVRLVVIPTPPPHADHA
jgi:hypothetical protein